jgi:hypothetical protein
VIGGVGVTADGLTARAGVGAGFVITMADAGIVADGDASVVTGTGGVFMLITNGGSIGAGSVGAGATVGPVKIWSLVFPIGSCSELADELADEDEPV